MRAAILDAEHSPIGEAEYGHVQIRQCDVLTLAQGSSSSVQTRSHSPAAGALTGSSRITLLLLC
jgi:hypothetical protein